MLGIGNDLCSSGASGDNFLDPNVITAPQYSMSFDGSGDYLNLAQEIGIPIDDEFAKVTLSFWAKRVIDGNESVVFGNSNTSSFQRLHFNAAGNVLTIEGDQNGEFGFATVTADTNWHHYAVTHVGNGGGSGGVGTLIMYEDGEAVSTDNTNNFGNVGGKELTINRIGGDEAGGDEEFNGLLYQVAVWSETLTPAAITAIYNSGTPIALGSNSGDYIYSSPGMMGFLWRFDENTGTTTTHSGGGTANIATLVGNAAFSSTTP